MEDIKLEVVIESVWVKIVATDRKRTEVARISTRNFPSQEQAEEFARTLVLRFNSIDAVIENFVNMRNSLAAAEAVTRDTGERIGQEAKRTRDSLFPARITELRETLLETAQGMRTLVDHVDRLIGS